MLPHDVGGKMQGRIWVTGANGLIGNYLLQASPRDLASNVIGLARSILDLTDFVAVSERFHQDRPALVIHCAAMSRSPECQLKPDLARKINIDVTRHLAELASDIEFIF